MNYEPKNKDYRKRVQASFDRQKFMDLIGAELVEVTPGYCEIKVPFNESLTQQHGFFHAGVISTLADNTAGYAAFSLMEADSTILTVEFKLNLLAPGKGDVLIGKAEVIKNGRTLTICRSEIYAFRDGNATLCAAGLSTLIELKNKSDYR
ncbi:MAG: PaaI family thioesterase [Bacteroidetes bacterium]|nr:MAG: PaaI family thioesterase [Bacteroidota bacterium]